LFLVVHLLVDVKDAMGANVVNSMLEALAPVVVKEIGGAARAKIVSNLATSRMVTATATWSHVHLGQELIDALLDVYAFACVDPYRAVTHNKGIMNGIDAVALATGNDFRAVEAGAHGFAAANASYGPLTHYTVDVHGDLVGKLQVPLAVGTVGGTTKSNSIAALCLKILGVQTAAELASVMAAVGLAQNFAALKALASEGIQKGHMRLHSRNVAINAGVPAHLVDDVACAMVADGRVSFVRARELLREVSHVQ
jgi:hydroxymethylglutaryl-CoA reductase